MGGAQEYDNSWMEEESSISQDKDKDFDEGGNIDFEEKIVAKEVMGKSSTNPSFKDMIGKSSTEASYNWEEESSNSQDSNFDIRKERLVIKFRRISGKYYMVEDIPLPSDSPYKYFNYKSIRYSFPTCFEYSTPIKKNNNPKINRCRICRKIFSKTSTLKTHRKTHAAFTPGPYTPKDFAKRFSTVSVSREPYKPAAHLKLLENVDPHPTKYEGYMESEGTLPYIKPGAELEMHNDTFTVGDMIGEGGFAKVFSAVWENGPLEERNTVLKVQMPANDWEWYILSQVNMRYQELDHPLKEKGGAEAWKNGFMSSPRCYTYRDGAVLISQFQKMGTLLDLVNLTKNADKSIIEPIAIFLTAELLGIMELLHSINIVHADLKPDNFLVRHIPCTTKSPSLQLIDFGKAVDVRLEDGGDAKPSENGTPKSNGQVNGGGIDARKKLDYSTLTTSEKQINGEEMEVTQNGTAIKEDEQKTTDITNGITDINIPNKDQVTENDKLSGEVTQNGTNDSGLVKEEPKKDGNSEGRTGKYHLDYFGIAGAAYCLLFGKYIEVGTSRNRWVVKGTFKRWWQVKTWESFFDDMLNPKDEGKESLPSLLQWRERFMALFGEHEELREGLDKARQVIENKFLEKWRRQLRDTEFVSLKT